MVKIDLTTPIRAPISVVFDLARDLGLHLQSTYQTRERIVAGKVSGLAELHDEVTFEAIHFCIRQRLTSRIVEMDPPRRFVDQMTKGAFKSLVHIHEFKESDGITTMRDIMEFAAPLGALGLLSEHIFLRSYMTRFLAARNQFLKATAEAR